MPEPTGNTGTVLSAEDRVSFRERGFVRVERACDAGLALELQQVIWDELRAEHGIEREDRGTWRVPPFSPRRAKQHPLNGQLAGPRFQGAISELLGHDDWPRPTGWGGFNVVFPDPEPGPPELPTDTWHWDGTSTSTGLLIFTFLSSVGARGGGPYVVSGSHRLIEEFYASLSPDELAQPHKRHRKLFAAWDSWLAALNGRAPQASEDRFAAFMGESVQVRGVPSQVVEFTGEPGDVIFCDLRLLHAVARNFSLAPRFVRVKFLFL